MVGEMSICPIPWNEYYRNVEEALGIIWNSALDDSDKERLEELIRVDTMSGYPLPCIKTWTDTSEVIDEICPPGASVAEVDWLKAQVRKLDEGNAL